VQDDDGFSLATSVSFDGGRTWENGGALPGSENGRNATVAFDAAGQGFVCGNTDRILVWRTDDGGRGFGRPAVVTREHTDYPSIAADTSGGSSGNLYVTFSAQGNTVVGFSRSTDGGRSFEAYRAIAEADGDITASPNVAVGKDGVICVTYGIWSQELAGTKKIADGQEPELRPEIIAPIMAVVSTDYGQTFGEPVELGRGVMEVRFTEEAGGPSLPKIALDENKDAIYATFIVRREGGDSTDVVVCASYDRGISWTEPMRVSHAVQGVHYFQPQITVDPAGRTGISAYVFEEGLVRTEFFVSGQRTLRFSRPRQVTAGPFDPAAGGLPGGFKHGTWWIGDHQGLTADAGAFHPVWSDTRTGELEIYTAAVATTSEDRLTGPILISE
jgi:hypothetical protein